MTPSRRLFDSIGTLVGTDSANLDDAAGTHLHLAGAAFVPSLDLDITHLIEPSYPGYAAVPSGTAAPFVYYDSANGLYTVQVQEPAGGWHFGCTSDPTDPAIIYGWFLTDHTDAFLLGSGLLNPQITVNRGGQAFDLPPMVFRFLNNSPN